MNTIRFYKVTDPFGFFSNFAAYPIQIGSMVWKTTEHYFQAQKFEDYQVQMRIHAIESPMKAALEGRNRSYTLVGNWESIKEEIMLKALRAKFFQHPELGRQLLETNDALLIEHTENDHYWGNGGDDSGKNRLGFLLMDVREELKQLCITTDCVLPPWIAFPDLHSSDGFWRMGLGEDYLSALSKFYRKDPTSYELQFPAIQGWEGFYES